VWKPADHGRFGKILEADDEHVSPCGACGGRHAAGERPAAREDSECSSAHVRPNRVSLSRFLNRDKGLRAPLKAGICPALRARSEISACNRIYLGSTWRSLTLL
jgi:hypothetical protein